MPNIADVVVLCGGAGLRLRSAIGNAPKGMADVAGRPFLELLLRQLRRHGFERAILAVGYRKDIIHSHFGERAFGLGLVVLSRVIPHSGRAGALRNAADLIESENALIMNGDSYTDADLGEFVVDHHEMKADVSVVVVPADGRGDGGSVVIDGNRQPYEFAEKEGLFHAAYINAGIYMMSRQLLAQYRRESRFRWRRELLPQVAARSESISRDLSAQGRCIDIGTPERYQSAQNTLANLEVDAKVPQCESQL